MLMTDTSIKELQMQVAEIKPFNAITNPSVHPAQKEAVIDIISKFKEKFLKGNEQARWYIDACGHQKYGLEIHEEHSSHFRIKMNDMVTTHFLIHVVTAFLLSLMYLLKRLTAHVTSSIVGLSLLIMSSLFQTFGQWNSSSVTR